MVGCGVILLLGPSLYIYGIFWLLPEVLDETYSWITQFIGYSLASWCLFGILSNMYMIRQRHSSIRSRFLKPPIVIAEPELELDSGAEPQDRVDTDTLYGKIWDLG